MRATLLVILLVLAAAVMLGQRYRAGLEKDRMIQEARTDLGDELLSPEEWERRQADQKRRSDSMRAAYDEKMKSFKARPSLDSTLKAAAAQRR